MYADSNYWLNEGCDRTKRAAAARSSSHTTSATMLCPREIKKRCVIRFSGKRERKETALLPQDEFLREHLRQSALPDGPCATQSAV